MIAQYAPWAGDRIWVRGDYTESAPAILAEDVNFNYHSNEEEEAEEGQSEGQTSRS